MLLSKISPVLFSIAILLGLTACCFSTIHFWQPDGVILVGGAKEKAIPFIVIILAAILAAKFQIKNLKLIPEVFIFGLVLIFCSDWLYNPYGLMPAPSSRGVILLFSLIAGFCLAIKAKINWSLVAISCLSLLIINFLNEANGRIITSDDHATFLHRLMQLRENLWNIPLYDPYWNAGYDQRYFFATGAIGYFLISLPLTLFFHPTEVYNFCFILAALVLPFFSTYLAARLLKFSVNASWIASLLVLAPSAEWYRWTFQTGTMGFVVATGLIPLNIALSIKILNTEEKFPLIYALTLIFTFTTMIFWSMSGLVFIPFIILALFKIFTAKLLKKNYISFVLASLLIINLPWIVTFLSVSKVGSFLKSEQQITPATTNAEGLTATADQRYKHKAGSFEFRKSLILLREFTSNANPLILFMALPGVLLLAKPYRWKLMTVLIWLIGTAVILFQIKPQLELDRFLVIASVLACLPCALAIEKILTINHELPAPRIFGIINSAFIAGFLVAAPISANAFINHQSLINYNFQGNLTQQLIANLEQYQGKGRALFSGMVMHEIDGGHLAAIPELAGTPTIASTFLHNVWNYKQVFPEEVLTNKDLFIPEYLNLNNVVVVLAHEPSWINYFQNHPELYQYKKQIGRFFLFDFLGATHTYFQEGSGQIIQQTNHNIKFKLDQPKATIRFRYFPFLETNSSCKLSPKIMLAGLSLIELSDCPINQEIIIKSKPAWQRISF